MNFSFTNFRFAYHSVVILLRIIVWTVLCIWIYNSFQYFEQNSFISLFYEFNKIEQNLPLAWSIIKNWLIEAGLVILKIIGLQLTISFIKAIPIFAKWIYKWDQNNEINSILGRLITTHFRNNSSLNFSELIELYKQSKKESYYVTKHSKNEQLDQFFKKYDSNYINDLHKK